MAETHKVITKVWIAPGCIVCDSCENDCPEVFDVQEQTCVIRPPAMKADFLKPLTPSIISGGRGVPGRRHQVRDGRGRGPGAVGRPESAGRGVAPAPRASAQARRARPPRHGAAGPEVAGAAQHQQDQPVALGRSGDDDPQEPGGRSRPRRWSGPSKLPERRTARPAAGDARRRRRHTRPRRRWATASATAAGRRPTPPRSTPPAVQHRARRRLGRAGRLRGHVAGDVPGLLRAQGAEGAQEAVWRVGRAGGLRESRHRLRAVQATPDGGRASGSSTSRRTRTSSSPCRTICTHLGCIPNWLPGDRSSSARATARATTSPASTSKARRRARWSGSRSARTPTATSSST